jgi:hypothetical protein
MLSKMRRKPDPAIIGTNVCRHCTAQAMCRTIHPDIVSIHTYIGSMNQGCMKCRHISWEPTRAARLIEVPATILSQCTLHRVLVSVVDSHTLPLITIDKYPICKAYQMVCKRPRNAVVLCCGSHACAMSSDPEDHAGRISGVTDALRTRGQKPGGYLSMSTNKCSICWVETLGFVHTCIVAIHER